MAIYRDLPYPPCHFTVDLGTGETWSPNTGLLEVVFPEARLVVTDYRPGNSKTPEPQKVQTGVEYGTLILRRTVNGSLDWYQWWNEFRNGSTGNTRSVTIHLMNEDLSNVVLTWKFFRARPVNHLFSNLTGLGGELFVESLELAFERLEME